MKKVLLAITALMASAFPAMASEVAYNQQLANQVVTTTSSFVLDLNAYGIDAVAFSATVSSATPQTQTFTDGHSSTATITVASTQSLVGVQGSDTILVLSTNGLTAAGINVNGTILYNNGWRIDKASNTAVDIATELGILTSVTASTTATTTVTVKCATAGSFCNNQTLAIVGTSSLTANTATFKNGQDPAFLIINSRTLTQGAQWSVVGSSVQVSTAIAAAINADPVLSTIMTATASVTCPNCGIVYTTSTILTSGSNNYQLYSSTPAGLVLSSNTFLAGTNSAYAINGKAIAITNHGLATGEQVLYSTSSAVGLTPLVWGTSYYVGVVDANDISLALTSTGAIAGTYITLTSSSTNGNHTYSLAPLALSGSAVLTWSASNDGLNYSTPTVTASNVTIGVNTLSTPWAQATYGYDFGNVAYRFLKLTVTGPTTAGQGGFNTVITGYGKRYWR